MKKNLFLIGAIAILLCSCSGKGEKHIKLNEVMKSYHQCGFGYEHEEVCEECKPVIDFFTVDPNSCVFSWCKPKYKFPDTKIATVKLSIKLEHNISPKSEFLNENPKELANNLAKSFKFYFFNDNGELLESNCNISLENSFDYLYNYSPSMTQDEMMKLWENQEKKMDFYMFATTAAPGSEYEMELCMGYMSPDMLNDIVKNAVGLKVMPTEWSEPQCWEIR